MRLAKPNLVKYLTICVSICLVVLGALGSSKSFSREKSTPLASSTTTLPANPDSSGPIGPQGEAGQDGAIGPQGPIGPTGAQGIAGATGPQGQTGTAGAIGPQGPVGPTGAQGIAGATGPQGQTGTAGAIGPQGPVGPTGAQGPQGETGQAGPRGPQGETGLQGLPGPQGETGATGATGSTGQPGGFGSNGSFFDTTTLLLPQNQAINVPLNTTAFSNGVSVGLDTLNSPTKIQFATSGKFNISFSMQLQKSDAGIDFVSIWLTKNNQNVDYTSTDITLSDLNERSRHFAAWNFFIDVNAGDYIQLRISATNNLKTSILYAPPQANPDRPAIPSTILTVNQVGN
jgi:hypothetical protein